MSPQPSLNISHTTPAVEAKLDWYREDPLANSHHEHWHIVYPNVAASMQADNPIRNQSRQGELFLYMHQQMLARYDTERRIAGLEPCEALTDLGAPIPEGYELINYRPRPAGSSASEPEWVERATDGYAESRAAVESGNLDLVDGNGQVTGQISLDENLLGCELESSFSFDDASPSPIPLRYPNAHGAGHVAIASASQQKGKFRAPMYYPETAIRDPVFYRWHRYVDDLYEAYQRGEPGNDFAQFAAPVSFRKEGAYTSDIALCLAKDIPGADGPDFDFRAWGEGALGVDLDKSGPTTDQLLTAFQRSNVTIPGGPSEMIPKEWLEKVTHLTHEPFVYFIRLRNEAQEEKDVTVRIFLAHADFAEKRRMWIELDKFKARLKPGGNLVARPDARSSVVKRKGLTVAGAEPSTGASTDSWCDCGWPYTLLLPSGESTPEGTPFKLMVAVTDWGKDQLGDPENCGSMSFCGARDDYPDARRMGYPFEREFDGYIRGTISQHPSMAMRDVSIRCTTVRPEG